MTHSVTETGTSTRTLAFAEVPHCPGSIFVRTTTDAGAITTEMEIDKAELLATLAEAFGVVDPLEELFSRR